MLMHQNSYVDVKPDRRTCGLHIKLWPTLVHVHNSLDSPSWRDRPVFHCERFGW